MRSLMSLRALGQSVGVLCLVLIGCGSEPDSIGGAGNGQFGDAGAIPGADGGGFDGGVNPFPGNDGGVLYSDASFGDGGCGSVRAMTEQIKAAVDVVWVIDDSFSMLPKVAAVIDNMGRF